MHKTLMVLTLSVFGIACIGNSDVSGEYEATMIRSSSLGCNVATPTPKIVETTVKIGDDIVIDGAFACTAAWSATDYGPVGTVDGVTEGCALQPSGTKFSGGGFGKPGFSMTWQRTDNEKCFITDEWTLGKKR